MITKAFTEAALTFYLINTPLDIRQKLQVVESEKEQYSDDSAIFSNDVIF